ncbi:hypothetical protein F1559_000159 [Cyanidiococcus yangmingshanensis]|uniref:Metal transporter cnnm2 n=1 Tax=Cyanidiococcus yangmingshanensis TaxID=2690220 RepID=A0A7J7IHB9_9RHOD|nr:hypothetical protein F1559_000159 [Cyanidiococcus yangmingshanensis]
MSTHAPTGVPTLERVRFPVLVAALFTTVAFCAVAAALAQALFSIDVIYLEALAKDPRSTYQRQAQTLLPLRRRGNLLLVSLVLIGTSAQELTALLADALLAGGTGESLLLSTVLVFVFGNILPVVYALQPEYGLRFAAACARLMRVILIPLYPVAFPIAWILDKTVGRSVLGVRALNRSELSSLLQFMQEHRMGDLGRDESTMLQATLNLRERTAGDVMTAASDVYMLSLDQVLDSKLALELVHQGHSRVPLYDGIRDNIVAYLLVKGLIAYSPSERLTVRDVILRYADRCVIATAPLEVSKSTSLELLLAEFQRGHSHMAIVYERPQSKRPKQRHFLGIVTLEDIIEDVLKQEIVDESDVYYDMQSKRPVTRAHPERFLSVESSAPSLDTNTAGSDSRSAATKATKGALGSSLARVVTSDQTIPRRSIDLARSTTGAALTASSYRGHGAPEMLSSRAVLGMRIPISRLRGTGYIAIREIDLKKLVPRGQRPRRKESADSAQRKARTLRSDGSDLVTEEHAVSSSNLAAAHTTRAARHAASPKGQQFGNTSQNVTSISRGDDNGDDDSNGADSPTVAEKRPLSQTLASSYGAMEGLSASSLNPSAVASSAWTSTERIESGRGAQTTLSIRNPSDDDDGDDNDDDDEDILEEDDSLSIHRSHSAFCLREPHSRSSSPDLEAAHEQHAKEATGESARTANVAGARIRFWRSRASHIGEATRQDSATGATAETITRPDERASATGRSTDHTLLRRWLLSAHLSRSPTE